MVTKSKRHTRGTKTRMTRRTSRRTKAKKTHNATRRSRRHKTIRRSRRRHKTRGGNGDLWVERQELVELLERAKDDLNKESNPNSTYAYSKANTVKMFEELLQEFDDNNPSAPVMK